MSNKWERGVTGTDGLRVVLFVSRNKDNAGLKDFTERRKSFLTSRTDEELIASEEFKAFVERGVNGEMARLYVSVNGRKNRKVAKQFASYLFDALCDGNEPNMAHISGILAGIAAKKENAAEKKWMFDYDDDLDNLSSFIEDLKDSSGFAKEEIETHKTLNGACVIVPRGFDVRKLMEKWKHVELKRDDMLCLSWRRKDFI